MPNTLTGLEADLKIINTSKRLAPARLARVCRQSSSKAGRKLLFWRTPKSTTSPKGFTESRVKGGGSKKLAAGVDKGHVAAKEGEEQADEALGQGPEEKEKEKVVEDPGREDREWWIFGGASGEAWKLVEN